MSHGLRWIVYKTIESIRAPTDVSNDTFFFSSCPRLIIPLPSINHSFSLGFIGKSCCLIPSVCS
ncbi:hypothetical protein HanHA300_Chr05g0169761 [Helianthus annuus]|nr:hypothetical protein HanHA300_Chr05g0169761 [Helianthus annuus]KAJ0584045.1 hypothetical protein HanHA89_Chr05g0183901 [Helianthus annuus]KAJ0749711.1 hypothetical protein HanLR1_Chr05g0173281 [Helianthus annuus]